MKKLILFFLMIVLGAGSYAFSVKKEYFVIRNYSSQVVVVTREFFDEIRWVTNTSFRQDVCGFNLSISPHLPSRNEIRLEPNKLYGYKILSFV